MRYRESIDKVNLSMHTSSYIFYAVPQSVAIVNILQFRTYQERGTGESYTRLFNCLCRSSSGDYEFHSMIHLYGAKGDYFFYLWYNYTFRDGERTLD